MIDAAYNDHMSGMVTNADHVGARPEVNTLTVEIEPRLVDSHDACVVGV